MKIVKTRTIGAFCGGRHFRRSFFARKESSFKPIYPRYVKKFFFEAFFACKFNKNRKKHPAFFCINRLFLHKTLDKTP